MVRGSADTASILSHHTASTAGRSIYPRGPQFSLDTFASKDFIVKDFVEQLSEGVGTSNRYSGSHSEAFDPKPHIRTFEYALSRLGVLSEERENHENELSLAVRRAEAQHKQHCISLQTKLDQALESFNSLEQRLESTLEKGRTNGHTATRSRGAVALHFGERLQELDRQRRRAEDAKFLIQCWQDVDERGDLSRLEDTRRMGGGQGKVKCAQIARQLLKISNNIDGPAIPGETKPPLGMNGDQETNGSDGAVRRRQTTNETIERFLERLEQDLLEQFDESKRQHNEGGMKECAAALYDFGEGASVIGRFVNQHEFFLERSHMLSEPVSTDNDLWNQLSDPDADSPGLELSLQSVVDEVKLVLQEESFTIKKVFPFHEQVITTFLQRVFQQSIQQRLEIVLEKADSVSSLAFLRTLQAARTYIVQMVDELKTHGLTDHPDSVSASVAAVIDQQLDDLFVPYTAGSSYIEREKTSLDELYSSLLFRFTLYHSKKRTKTPNSTYLGSLSQRGRELLSAARDRYVERLDSSDLSPGQKATLLRLAGLRDTDTAKDRTEIEVTDEEGALSPAVTKRMLKWLAEACGRSLELSGGTETPKDMATLLKIVTVHLGDIYVDTALDTASDAAASQENSKTEPDLSFINDMRVSVSILELIMSISNSVLLPLATPNVTVKREMEKSIATSITRMEDKITAIRVRTLDVVLSWVTKLLARQTRTDFRPRDDAFGLDQLQTQTCNSIFAFLSKVRDLSTKSYGGPNVENFFTELAIGFRGLLFEHFKKFQVNLAGGLMVSKDITRYIELLRSFPLAPSFLPSLEVLVEVGNIFVIGPEALKDRLRGGGALTGVDKADLRPYIMRREDVNSIGVQSILNSL